MLYSVCRTRPLVKLAVRSRKEKPPKLRYSGIFRGKEITMTAKNTPPKRDAAFVRDLLTWYAAHKRDMPWRRENADPYAVWVSEMMLQQTQVATATPYFVRWMARFPTVADLADAPLDDVLHLWQGLGYYARARSLHKAAQIIQTKYGGVFPTNFDDVLALPSVGRYTAGAICSIALKQDVPLVDANVVRVLCRVFGIYGDPKASLAQAALWETAARLIPKGNAGDFNQALMELGALVCVPKPKCAVCPVSEVCAAFATGKPEKLPEFAPRKAFTSQTDVSAVVFHPSGDNRRLIVKRPEGGLWGGLWEMPRVTRAENETLQQAAERAACKAARLSVRAETGDEAILGRVRHGVTTRKITLVGVVCTVTSEATLMPQLQTTGGTESLPTAWVAPGEIGSFAVSSPQARLWEAIDLTLAGRKTQPSLFSEAVE